MTTKASYSNVMGGKLQLKGDPLPTINKTIKKKKKKKSILDTAKAPEDNVKFADYKEPENEEGVEDSRTPAEIAYEKAQQRRMEAMAKKMAAKSHREKIEEFNKRLANMSEHYDIPKVGPG